MLIISQGHDLVNIRGNRNVFNILKIVSLMVSKQYIHLPNLICKVLCWYTLFHSDSARLRLGTLGDKEMFEYGETFQVRYESISYLVVR